jgi:hypothetical protein
MGTLPRVSWARRQARIGAVAAAATLVALAGALVLLGPASHATAGGSATRSLDVAVAQISHEVAFLHTQVPREPRAYLDALATLEYTVGHVNAAVYGWREDVSHGPLPDCRKSLAMCAENTLEQEAGICGNAAAVFEVILDRLGVRAHRLNLFYTAPNGTKGGHTTAEAFWQGRWHMMDPTWGVFFRRSKAKPAAILSHAQVAQLTRPSLDLIQDRSHLWWQVSSVEMHDGWSTGFKALLDQKARAVVVPG